MDSKGTPVDLAEIVNQYKENLDHLLEDQHKKIAEMHMDFLSKEQESIKDYLQQTNAILGLVFIHSFSLLDLTNFCISSWFRVTRDKPAPPLLRLNNPDTIISATPSHLIQQEIW